MRSEADRGKPGFKHFIVSIEIYAKLKYAEVERLSSMRKIFSGWEILNQQWVKIEVSVPFNTRATIIPKDILISSVGDFNKYTVKDHNNKIILKVNLEN